MRSQSIDISFSQWLSWKNRNALSNTRYPGVYAIAKSDENLTDVEFSIFDKIIYFGMTNSKGGIRSRLNQFENSLQGKTSNGHGGADRIKYKYRNYDEVVEKLYVAVMPVQCDVSSNLPDDLRLMGKIAALEYECFARFSEVFGKKPEFNDHKVSPYKYTLHVLRKSTQPHRPSVADS